MRTTLQSPTRLANWNAAPVRGAEPRGGAAPALPASAPAAAASVRVAAAPKSPSVAASIEAGSLRLFDWSASQATIAWDWMTNLFSHETPWVPIRGDEPVGGGGMPTLSNGARGENVAQLQRKLQAAGFSIGSIDGVFGTQTEAALRVFQMAHRLTVDGVAGPKTWEALGVAGSAPAAANGGVSSKAAEFIANAKRFLGQRYLWGGGHTSRTMTSPGRVDCSGLVMQAARLSGFNVDGTAATQQRRGTPVSLKALQPGDLLFKGSPASHVGIYVGNGQFIHAPRTGSTVQIDRMSDFNWDSARRLF